MTKPKCVTQDKRKALHLATSYALESFVHLKEVGAALDDVLARQADFHKKNPRHIVVLTYGVVRFRKRRSRSVTRAKATSTSTSQTSTPEAPLVEEATGQIKNKN